MRSGRGWGKLSWTEEVSFTASYTVFLKHRLDNREVDQWGM